jgi:hypothetical protein
MVANTVAETAGPTAEDDAFELELQEIEVRAPRKELTEAEKAERKERRKVEKKERREKARERNLAAKAEGVATGREERGGKKGGDDLGELMKRVAYLESFMKRVTGLETSEREDMRAKKARGERLEGRGPRGRGGSRRAGRGRGGVSEGAGAGRSYQREKVASGVSGGQAGGETTSN